MGEEKTTGREKVKHDNEAMKTKPYFVTFGVVQITLEIFRSLNLSKHI